MITRRDVLRLAAGSAALAGCGPKASDGQVRVLTHPGQILPIFTHHAAALERRGVKLKLSGGPSRNRGVPAGSSASGGVL